MDEKKEHSARTKKDVPDVMGDDSGVDSDVMGDEDGMDSEVMGDGDASDQVGTGDAVALDAIALGRATSSAGPAAARAPAQLLTRVMLRSRRGSPDPSLVTSFRTNALSMIAALNQLAEGRALLRQ